MISALQIRRFWTAFRPAWEAYAGRKGLDVRDRAVAESWRHAILAEECAGQSSLKTLSQGDYDAVMLRLAVESGKQAAVAYWAPADERRMRHLIREKLREMSEADPPNRYGERYALAIVRQAKLASPPRTLDDLPAALLRKVLIALDRRLRKLREAALEPAPF
ncbi:MAG: hypothetical protein IJS32_02505 [Kiritimatiellae bacterium]|nr:hypothetical protein [Kiritimatiellia bacterium]